MMGMKCAYSRFGTGGTWLPARITQEMHMSTLNRRDFVRLAAAMGASLAWGGSARASTTGWRERRDLYPEGVASGDPDAASVVLWTRRPFADGRHVLTVEVAEDDTFRRVVARASAPVAAESAEDERRWARLRAVAASKAAALEEAGEEEEGVGRAAHARDPLRGG